MDAIPSSVAPGQAHAAREGARFVGTVPAASLHAGQIGIVVDGVLRHAVFAEPDGAGMAAFSFPLRGLTFPATLDVEELATGRRLLPEPVATADAFTLDELRFDGPTLQGTFSLAWAPHPFLPIAFLSGGIPAARGVAEHDRGAPGAEGRAAYRFRAPLASLPAGPLTVHPVVAAVPRPEATRTLDCPFAGYIDHQEGPAIFGWAANTVAPGETVPLEVRRGGRVIAAGVTDRPRPDVAQAIPGAILCGFTLTVPVSERMRRSAEPYRVVIGGTDTALRDGSVQVEPVSGRLNRLDAARGGVVSGWALDGELDGPVPIEVRRDGVVLATGTADLFRADLAAQGLGAPGLPAGYCAFSVRLPGAVAAAEGPLEVLAAGHAVDGSPATMAPNPNLTRFLARRDAVRPEVLPRLRAALDRAAGRRSVSLVLAACGAEPEELSATLNSVAAQWCSRWEVVCVHDGFAEPAVARAVAQLARRDPRIRMVPAAASDGPAALLSAGLAAVRSGYAAVLRPGDRLEPDAVYQLLRAVRDTGADVLFTDAATLAPSNDKVGTGKVGTGKVSGIEARTAFSADRFRSAPFWPDLLCVRTALAQSLPADAGIGFAAQAVAAADRIAHVPAVAVVRPPAPHGENPPALAPFPGTLLAPVLADVVPDWLRGLPVPCRPVLLGEDARPASVNAAVKREGEGCAGLLLLRGGVARPAEGSMERLLSLLARADVAAAGPVVCGPDGLVAAAGLVLGGSSGVAPGHAGAEPADVGRAVRDVSALPGTLLLVGAGAWAEVGGYDSGFAGGLPCDADLCLRLRAAGRSVLLDGGAVVTAGPLPASDPADRALFAARQGMALRRGDPWYSPFLDPGGSWMLRDDDGCRTVHPARVVSRRRPAEAGPGA